MLALILTLGLLLGSPVAALAQTSAGPSPANSAGSGQTTPASPSQGAAASAKPAAGAAQQTGGNAASASPSAAGSAAPAASTAAQSAAPSASPVRAVPTPVGGNAPKETIESMSWFAYLLIVLAVIWFVAAIIGIVRLLSRPRTMEAALPPPERDRPFLSFFMPLGALVTVFIILSIWGLLFLWVSHYSELYPLAIDLFVVCLVMLIATIAALREGGQPRSEVH
jgi:hypothetical protein